MKRSLLTVLLLLLCTFVACKKAEEAPEPEKNQNKTQANEPGKRRAKAPGPAALEIYKEDKVVATIPQKDYPTITTGTVKIDGKDYKAILLTDLLKKYNVTGKNIILKGPAKEVSLTWEQVSANPIYIYLGKKRLQIYPDDKVTDDLKLPTVLIRLTASEKPAEAAPTQAKGAKKQK